MERDDPAHKGQAGYNPVLLAIYDPWVLGFMSRTVWHVPVATVIDQYRASMGHRHLDVGPGTGYFIDKQEPRLMPRSPWSIRTATFYGRQARGSPSGSPASSRQT